jgi:alanyl-tRNA synthetase
MKALFILLLTATICVAAPSNRTLSKLEAKNKELGAKLEQAMKYNTSTSSTDRALQKDLHASISAQEKAKKEVSYLKSQVSTLKKEVELADLERAAADKKILLSQKVQSGNVNCIVGKVNARNADAAKNIAFQLKNEVENLFCVLGWDTDNKPGLAVMISDNLVNEMQLDASAIVRDLAKEIQGGGGGQKFFATAGGKNSDGLQSALAKAEKYLAKA